MSMSAAIRLLGPEPIISSALPRFNGVWVRKGSEVERILINGLRINPEIEKRPLYADARLFIVPYNLRDFAKVDESNGIIKVARMS